MDVPDKDESITDVISSTDTGFAEDLSETDCVSPTSLLSAFTR